MSKKPKRDKPGHPDKPGDVEPFGGGSGPPPPPPPPPPPGGGGSGQ